MSTYWARHRQGKRVLINDCHGSLVQVVVHIISGSASAREVDLEISSPRGSQKVHLYSRGQPYPIAQDLHVRVSDPWYQRSARGREINLEYNYDSQRYTIVRALR